MQQVASSVTRSPAARIVGIIHLFVLITHPLIVAAKNLCTDESIPSLVASYGIKIFGSVMVRAGT